MKVYLNTIKHTIFVYSDGFNTINRTELQRDKFKMPSGGMYQFFHEWIHVLFVY